MSRLVLSEHVRAAGEKRRIHARKHESECDAAEPQRTAAFGAVLAANRTQLLRAFWDAARDVEPERGAAADEGVVMRWCREGELAELWRAAGLQDVSSGSLTVRASYTDFEDLWSPFPTGVAPSGAFCKSLNDERRAALHDAYRQRLGVGNGPFELTARAWAVAGTVATG